MKHYTSIQSYIAAQSPAHRKMLEEMYQIIKAKAPTATEAITYGMPTFVGNKNLVHFAAMKGHLGFYPTPNAVTHFAHELKKFSTSKGCIRFPYGKPLPKKLIDAIVQFRIKEDRAIKTNIVQGV